MLRYEKIKRIFYFFGGGKKTTQIVVRNFLFTAPILVISFITGGINSLFFDGAIKKNNIDLVGSDKKEAAVFFILIGIALFIIWIIFFRKWRKKRRNSR